MKLAIYFQVLFLFIILFPPVSAIPFTKNVVVLTANQVDSAVDVEATGTFKDVTLRHNSF
jgi:hypothetical protein